jgi:hypothetical protein
MVDQSLPAPVQDFLDAQRRLLHWAASDESADRRGLVDLALFPRHWHLGHLQEAVREAVREAGVPRGECRFTSEEAGVMKLLVAPGMGRLGVKHLRDFTNGAERVTVIDPYFFRCGLRQVSEAVERIADATCLKKNALKVLHVVHLPERGGNQGAGERALLHAVKDLAGKSHIRFSHKASRDVHDRVWVADGKRAVAVGTSLNGLGTRAAFILELPDDDLRELQGFLRERGLSA